jgi:hypothetical protein
MGRTIFFHAVLHRQAKLFSLIYSIDDQKLMANTLDASTSILDLLHMAGMLEPSPPRDRIVGEALKMQSELQWFKVISLSLYSSNVLTLISWMFQFF